MIIFILVGVWLLGALMALKMDALFCMHQTDYDAVSLVLSLCFWPVVAILMLTCKHMTGTMCYSKNQDGVLVSEVLREEYHY